MRYAQKYILRYDSIFTYGRVVHDGHAIMRLKMREV